MSRARQSTGAGWAGLLAACEITLASKVRRESAQRPQAAGGCPRSMHIARLSHTS